MSVESAASVPRFFFLRPANHRVIPPCNFGQRALFSKRRRLLRGEFAAIRVVCPPRAHLPVDGPLRALMGAATWALLRNRIWWPRPLRRGRISRRAIEYPNATVNPQMRPPPDERERHVHAALCSGFTDVACLRSVSPFRGRAASFRAGYPFLLCTKFFLVFVVRLDRGNGSQ